MAIFQEATERGADKKAALREVVAFLIDETALGLS
jgi:hypothetical protein